MGSMKYCRFQNMAPDLRDCVEDIDKPLCSEEEHEARLQIVEMCKEVLEQIGVDVDLVQYARAIRKIEANPVEE